MGAAVAVESVTKRFASASQPLTALDRVTFAVSAGGALGVTGPSGSGKSTLLHLVGAMDVSDEGRITVGDFAVTELDRKGQVAYRRTIGFVFQRFHLLPALTALDNVAAPVLPYRTDFDRFGRARDLLDAVGLRGKEESLPAQLSGGEQQRVAIARALINDPQLLLADEPTGNLDSETSVEIMELLLHLRRERGMTLVVATHDPLIATRCDSVVRLLDGRVSDEVEVTVRAEPESLLERVKRYTPS